MNYMHIYTLINKGQMQEIKNTIQKMQKKFTSLAKLNSNGLHTKMDISFYCLKKIQHHQKC